MKQYKNIATVLIVMFSLLLVSGCKSKKTLTTGGELTNKTHKEVVADALKSEINFRTITSKGSIELKSGSSSNKVPAVFKIIKDSVLQVSLRIPIIGGEALRMDMTPENIVIIDRIKKQYFSENFKDSEFLKQLDFNFYNLQALFTNKLFVPGKQEVEYNDYNNFVVNVANELYMLQTKGKGSLSYNFAVDATDHIVSTLIYNEKQNLSLQWSYTDFIKDNELTYPTSMQAKIEVVKKRADINISYNKLEIDKDFSVDTSIPSKYAKVSFKDLLGSYLNLK
ncbi:lipoprotein insertase outer membrane protein LolB1 [Dysgonomonas reticulitermitis]